MKSIPLIIIAGPTAVGKTALSLDLAEKFGTGIISADSMQIYRHMDIGTAKPTAEEMKGIPHYMIDVADPQEDFSAARFKELAQADIKRIHSEGKIPIIAGGTGLYINSLIYDMDFSGASSNSAAREELKKIAHENGAKALHQKLKEVSPENAQKIHPNNVKRVIRALEIYYDTGNEKKDFSSGPAKNPDYFPILMVLNRDRKSLYERINERVEIMVAQGLLEEVEKLIGMGCEQNMISMKGIGYKEIINHLRGQCSFEHAVEEIKKNSRRYAKRQITWFKRYEFAKWFDIDRFEGLCELESSVTEHIEHSLSQWSALNGNEI